MKNPAVKRFATVRQQVRANQRKMVKAYKFRRHRVTPHPLTMSDTDWAKYEEWVSGFSFRPDNSSRRHGAQRGE